MVKFAAWNARSIKPKTASVSDFIIFNKLDILAITESWLTDDSRSDRALVDIRNTLPNFELHHIPRTSAKGGGVCMILRKGFTVTVNEGVAYSTLEHLDLTINVKSSSVRFFVVYRPPYSKKNRLTTRMFFSDFSTMLESVNNIPSRVLLAGDFNTHMDDKEDRDTITMTDMLSSTGLRQHVNTATHKNDHILDLLITRDYDDTISNIKAQRDLPSDHSATRCYLDMARPEPVRHKTSFRKLRQIDIDQFKQDISSSPLIMNPSPDLRSLVERYDCVLSGGASQQTCTDCDTIYHTQTTCSLV